MKVVRSLSARRESITLNFVRSCAFKRAAERKFKFKRIVQWNEININFSNCIPSDGCLNVIVRGTVGWWGRGKRNRRRMRSDFENSELKGRIRELESACVFDSLVREPTWPTFSSLEV